MGKGEEASEKMGVRWCDGAMVVLVLVLVGATNVSTRGNGIRENNSPYSET